MRCLISIFFQVPSSNSSSYVAGEQQSEGELPFEISPKSMTIHERKWTDGSIPLNALPENLVMLGKVYVITLVEDHSVIDIAFN